MTPEPKKHNDDDGRVICNMDVEGLRWHDRRTSGEKSAAPAGSPGGRISRSEAWRYSWSAVLAGLSIVLVFSATWVLFVLFCTEIWFR